MLCVTSAVRRSADVAEIKRDEAAVLANASTNHQCLIVSKEMLSTSLIRQVKSEAGL